MIDSSQLADKLVSWIIEQVQSAKLNGVVFGLSGGVDSAVVAGLAKRAFPNDSIGVFIPISSSPEDREHANLCADTFGLKMHDIDLTEVFQTLLTALSPTTENMNVPRLAIANLKPRLRMTSLYYIANTYSYLVLGTGNLSEITVGYFTKYGDGGVDISPIAGLVKSQVRDLAVFLGVPKVIIDKAPSAGLWENQTDENEMGFTYEELDRYILSGQGPVHIVKKIEAMSAGSAHKRRLPLVP
ncbi:MAG: NAD(+) synthase [bacterium]|nr:NAD(+) synthase [bacterium]